MKTLTITVSDEMAAHLETIRDTFHPGEDLGRVFDDGIAGWLVERIATDGDECIEQVIDSYEFETTDEAFGLGERVDSLLERLGHSVPVCWFTEDRPNGKYGLRSIHSEKDEAILDFAIAKGWSFDWLRETFREKVAELDEKAGLPARNWTQNPVSNVGEILAMIEADQEKRASATA